MLVVGAGLSGLSAAMFLGLHGIKALVVERHPGTSLHPKARGQFPHTMEALRLAGVDRKMVEASPPDPTFRIVVAKSASGPVFNELVIDGQGPDLSALSSAGWANCSQERAEPILAERARELGAEIRFSTELTGFEQDADGVTAVLTDLETGVTTSATRSFSRRTTPASCWRTLKSPLGGRVRGPRTCRSPPGRPLSFSGGGSWC
jgi:putative polyketide hydroxylase